jgi:3'-phosphoadenosine 5'-phosphosulfate sulfotransferase (PAPS reductase)/FAD synthetase
LDTRKARETLRFKKRIGELWNLEVVKLTGAHGALARQAALYGSDLYARDPDTCCRINKVEPGALDVLRMVVNVTSRS